MVPVRADRLVPQNFTGRDFLPTWLPRYKKNVFHPKALKGEREPEVCPSTALLSTQRVRPSSLSTPRPMQFQWKKLRANSTKAAAGEQEGVGVSRPLVETNKELNWSVCSIRNLSLKSGDSVVLTPSNCVLKAKNERAVVIDVIARRDTTEYNVYGWSPHRL